MPAITVKITLELEVEVEGTYEEWEVTDVYLLDNRGMPERVPFAPALQPLWNAIYAQASDTIQDKWEN